MSFAFSIPVMSSIIHPNPNNIFVWALNPASQIYTHVLDERAKAMVRDLHPLGDEEGG